MKVQSYMFFDGRTEEAIEFYQQAVGAELVSMMRYSECPDAPPPGIVPPGSEHKIMHASFRIGETELMASDGSCGNKSAFQGISQTISVVTVEQAEKLFAALGEGGQVQMPMTQTFFSPRFGMVADKFGVSWMVLAEMKR